MRHFSIFSHEAMILSFREQLRKLVGRVWDRVNDPNTTNREDNAAAAATTAKFCSLWAITLYNSTFFTVQLFRRGSLFGSLVALPNNQQIIDRCGVLYKEAYHPAVLKVMDSEGYFLYITVDSLLYDLYVDTAMIDQALLVIVGSITALRGPEDVDAFFANSAVILPLFCEDLDFRAGVLFKQS